MLLWMKFDKNLSFPAYSQTLQTHSHSNTQRSAHFKPTSPFQHTCEHSPAHRWVKHDLALVSASETYTSNLEDITTHHWLRRLGVAWVLLRVGGGGGGVGGLGLGRGLGGRGAAV